MAWSEKWMWDVWIFQFSTKWTLCTLCVYKIALIQTSVRLNLCATARAPSPSMVRCLKFRSTDIWMLTSVRNIEARDTLQGCAIESTNFTIRNKINRINGIKWCNADSMFFGLKFLYYFFPLKKVGPQFLNFVLQATYFYYFQVEFS